MASTMRFAAILLLAGVFACVEGRRRNLHTVSDLRMPEHRVLLTDRKGETNTIDTTLKLIAKSYDLSPDGSGVVLGEVRTINGDVLEVSNQPDFTSLLPQGDTIYAFVHFESPKPSEMYLMALKIDDKGDIKPKSWKRVDWKPFGGLWTPCAGSVTPWNTHLGSEEYEPDARAVADFISGKEKELDGDVEDYMRYFGPNQNTTAGVKKFFKPYLYGHVTEAAATKDGDYKINKWFSMGRIAMELPLVMPDRKTVYLTDDGDNVGFFKFVAERPGDLSKGSLYAAKFKQMSAANGGKFSVTWILLGKGDQAVLKTQASTLGFYDIFSVGDVANCKAPFKLSNKGGKVECLQVKPGMENAAAFFETRRYANYLGATTEWSKWEGITYDPLRKKLYTAMSENKNGMEDNAVKGTPDKKFDEANYNDIRLPFNQCGCIYSLDVDSRYSATSMEGLLCGTPVGAKNCSVDSIANPDNVAFMEGYGVLLIGEDSSIHAPNLLWSYDVANKKLKKLAEALPGAENTGTYFYDNIKGKQYILNTFQHPDGGLHAEINYIGPLDLKKSEPVVFDTPFDEI